MMTLSGLGRTARAVALAVRSPADALLLIDIAVFITRLPARMQRSNVADYFHRLALAPRPRSATIDQSYARIARLRDACLALPRLWRRDTCYIRALTLLRFLDAGPHRMRVHFGVEQPQSAGERLRGHAWISIDGRTFEAPDAVYEARVREVPIGAAP